MPPGLANVPPGQAKKFDDYTSSFVRSPDDYFENSYEADVDDIFEVNYDGTNKGKGNGKGMFGAWPGKSGEAPGKIKASTKDGGNPNCGTKGITDEDAATTSLTIDTLYTIDVFTAIGNNCKDISSNIKFNMIAPNGTTFFGNNPNVYQGTQPDSITLDDFGYWEIQTKVQSFKLDRIINVPGGVTADAGPDQNPITEGAIVYLNGTGSSATLPATIASYLWEYNSQGQAPALNSTSSAIVQFTAPDLGDSPSGKEYEWKLTVTDSDSNVDTDIVIITIFR